MITVQICFRSGGDLCSARLANCRITRQAWLALQERFSNVFRVSIMHLKIELQNLRKGSEYIGKYLQRVKNARDQLLSVGVSVSDKDIIVVILNGLSEEYSIVRTMIEGGENHISLHDLRSQLLIAKSRMEGSLLFNSGMFAMVARGDNAKGGGDRSVDNKGWNKHDSKGKGSSGDTECLACGKRGHTVDTCFRIHECQVCGNHGNEGLT